MDTDMMNETASGKNNDVLEFKLLPSITNFDLYRIVKVVKSCFCRSLIND